MGKWKAAFSKSYSPEFGRGESDFVFHPPATAEQIASLESELGASLPPDLKDMLLEFNGIDHIDCGQQFPYVFSTATMTTKVIEVYSDWDWPTELLLEWSKNIAYVRQVNGYSQMWGVVVKPFGGLKYGQVVGFDHDEIAHAEKPKELFSVTHKKLADLISG